MAGLMDKLPGMGQVPEHLKTLFKLCIDSSHYYRQHWYWAGEADLRVNGPKMKLTTIPAAAMTQPEDLASLAAQLLELPASAVPFELKINCVLEP
jgi:hypothetical protein